MSTDTEPVPCEDRPRACKHPKLFRVEAGEYAGGHAMGRQSCDKHLADTVRYVARFAQPVRVLTAAATPAQENAFIAARGTIESLVVSS